MSKEDDRSTVNYVTTIADNQCSWDVT